MRFIWKKHRPTGLPKQTALEPGNLTSPSSDQQCLHWDIPIVFSGCVPHSAQRLHWSRWTVYKASPAPFLLTCLFPLPLVLPYLNFWETSLLWALPAPPLIQRALPEHPFMQRALPTSPLIQRAAQFCKTDLYLTCAGVAPMSLAFPLVGSLSLSTALWYPVLFSHGHPYPDAKYLVSISLHAQLNLLLWLSCGL